MLLASCSICDFDCLGAVRLPRNKWKEKTHFFSPQGKKSATQKALKNILLALLCLFF